VDHTPNYILRVRQVYPALTGKYKAIADQILHKPGNVLCRRAKDLARDCNCDAALVVRFCQRLGYKGFDDLRIAVAAEFLPVSPPLDRDEHQGAFARMRREFLEKNSRALRDTVSLLREKEVSRAVDMLSVARRIYLLGAGASGIVALDAQIKLERLGFDVVCHQDAGLAKTLLGLVKRGDAVLAISHSGETRSVHDAALAAKKRGARLVVITNYPQSSLAALADVKLVTAAEEGSFRLGAMTSRVAQYLVLDFVVVSLAMRDMGGIGESIVKTHDMINDKL
jgi:DNA-binding MurR/RpiR family transcriptional regulator